MCLSCYIHRGWLPLTHVSASAQIAGDPWGGEDGAKQSDRNSNPSDGWQVPSPSPVTPAPGETPSGFAGHVQGSGWGSVAACHRRERPPKAQPLLPGLVGGPGHWLTLI